MFLGTSSWVADRVDPRLSLDKPSGRRRLTYDHHISICHVAVVSRITFLI